MIRYILILGLLGYNGYRPIIKSVQVTLYLKNNRDIILTE